MPPDLAPASTDPFLWDGEQIAHEIARLTSHKKATKRLDPETVGRGILHDGLDGEDVLKGGDLVGGFYEALALKCGADTLPRRLCFVEAVRALQSRSREYRRWKAACLEAPENVEESPPPTLRVASPSKAPSPPRAPSPVRILSPPKAPSPPKARSLPRTPANTPEPTDSHKRAASPLQPQPKRRAVLTTISSVPTGVSADIPSAADWVTRRETQKPNPHPTGHRHYPRSRFQFAEFDDDSDDGDDDDSGDDDGDDDALPVFGESDDDGYDDDTMREFDAEEAERTRLAADVTAGPTRAEEIVDACIERMMQTWTEKKLPREQRDAWKTWHGIRGGVSRAERVRRCIQDLAHFSARLEKLRSEVLLHNKDTASRVGLENATKNLEETVHQRESMRWRRGLLLQKNPPPRPPPQSRNRALPKTRILTTEDGEEELLTSDDDGDFVVLDKEVPRGRLQRPDTDITSGIRPLSVGEQWDLESAADNIMEVDGNINQKGDEQGPPPQEETEDELLDVDDLAGFDNGSVAAAAADDDTDLVDGVRRRALQVRLREVQAKRILRLRKELAGQPSAVDRRLIVNESKKATDGLICVNNFIGGRIKGHQIEGVRFLWDQMVAPSDPAHRSGCMLAHDMGLGKTMQVITFLTVVAEAALSPDPRVSGQIPKDMGESRTVVLCPAALVDNWIEELGRWCPEPDEDRPVGSFYKLIEGGKAAETIEAWDMTGGIIVIGFERFLLARMESDSARRLLEERANIVIADEAHRMKNPETQLRQATDCFRTQYRIALTGSPLANNVGEYFWMINWVAPGFLGEYEWFARTFERPIMEGFWKDSTPELRKSGVQCLSALTCEVAPKVHRFTVADLPNDLPQRHEFVIVVPPTSLQRDLYRLYHEQEAEMLKKRGAFVTQSALVLICNHPKCYIDKILEDAGGSPDRLKPQEKIALSIAAQIGQERLLRPEYSYKVFHLLAILREARRLREKTLIFSSSVPTMQYIRDLLQRMGRQCSYLDGKTAVGSRQELVRNFNINSHEVFIISTNAGNVGLNIQGASRVVIMDRKWNPVEEQQAIGRAYRIGQRRTVYVYRFVMEGSYEEGMHNKAVFKEQLAARVVDQAQPIAHSDKPQDVFGPLRHATEPTLDELPNMAEIVAKDVILPRLLRVAAHKSGIVSVTNTDTFKEQEPENLTQEDARAVELMRATLRDGARNPLAVKLRGGGGRTVDLITKTTTTTMTTTPTARPVTAASPARTQIPPTVPTALGIHTPITAPLTLPALTTHTLSPTSPRAMGIATPIIRSFGGVSPMSPRPGGRQAAMGGGVVIGGPSRSSSAGAAFIPNSGLSSANAGPATPTTNKVPTPITTTNNVGPPASRLTNPRLTNAGPTSSTNGPTTPGTNNARFAPRTADMPMPIAGSDTHIGRTRSADPKAVVIQLINAVAGAPAGNRIANAVEEYMARANMAPLPASVRWKYLAQLCASSRIALAIVRQELSVSFLVGSAQAIVHEAVDALARKPQGVPQGVLPGLPRPGPLQNTAITTSKTEASSSTASTRVPPRAEAETQNISYQTPRAHKKKKKSKGRKRRAISNSPPPERRGAGGVVEVIEISD